MDVSVPPPYSHQIETTDFIISHPRCLITSDPGTGKTRAVLDAHIALKAKTLVLAPLSILEAAWADDIDKFLIIKILQVMRNPSLHLIFLMDEV